jgi:hypothetical protein
VAKWISLEIIATEYASGYGDVWPEEGEKKAPDFGEERPVYRWRPKILTREAAPSPAALPTDPHELDALACSLAKERLTVELDLGPLLAKLRRHRVWWEFRCSSREEYVREWLRIGVRTVRQKIWLERVMDEMPEIRVALRNGKLTYTKALFVAKHATPRDVVKCIEEAASTTVEQTQKESDEREDRQNRAAGVRRLWGPEEPMETVFMAIRAWLVIRWPIGTSSGCPSRGCAAEATEWTHSARRPSAAWTRARRSGSARARPSCRRSSPTTPAPRWFLRRRTVRRVSTTAPPAVEPPRGRSAMNRDPASGPWAG